MSTITASTTSGTGYSVTSDTSGQLVIQTGSGPTTAVTIDGSQNVGIGTSSPTQKLDVVSASGNVSLRVRNDNGIGDLYALSAGDIFLTAQSTGRALLFGTLGAERMRITSAGETLVAGNTDNGAFNLQCNGTGVWGAGAYTNGSDARIKEDIAPIDSGLDVVAKLNPVTYRYKEDWSKDQSIQPGFIAQELLVALDGKNYVDGVVQQGGTAGYYSVAYQNIIPVLTKAIQEQQAIIEQLQQRIEALEAK